MKYLTLFTLIFLFIGCEDRVEGSYNSGVERAEEPESTIKEVENDSPFGTHVEIIMAKGHEYIIAYDAGMVHSESCPNSKHVRSELEDRMSN